MSVSEFAVFSVFRLNNHGHDTEAFECILNCSNKVASRSYMNCVVLKKIVQKSPMKDINVMRFIKLAKFMKFDDI